MSGELSRGPLPVVLFAMFLVACGGREELDIETGQERIATTSYLSGVSEFHWATSESFDRVAMRFRFQLPASPATCTFKTAKCFQWNDLGLSSWQVTTASQSQSWGGWSPVRGGDYVVAGPVDTRFEVEVDEPMCETSSETHNLFSGVMDHYTFGTDVKPQPFPSGHTLSVAVSLECDAPFDVVGAEAGSEATLFNWETLNVVAVNQEPAGNLMIGTGSEVLTSETSGYFTGHSGTIEGAFVYVEAPDGPHASAPFELGPVSSGWLEHTPAGPGPYDIEVARASAAEMGTWWLLTYGLDRSIDLGLGLLSESAIDW